MRFEQLRYLATSVEAGSFRQAARQLGVAQPSITAQVQRLEEELDIILVRRDVQGVRPTYAAERIMPHVLAALDAQEAIRREADALGHMEHGQIQISTVASAGRSMLPRVLKRFLAAHPNAQFTATQGGSDSVRRGVLHGEFDLGLLVRLGDETCDEDDHLQYVELKRGRLVLVVPDGHPLADKDAVTSQDLQGERLVVFKHDSVLRTAFERLADVDANVVYITESADSATEMVRSGLGISLANSLSPSTTSGNGVSLIPIQLDWAVTHLVAVVRRGEFRDPLVHEFLRLLKEDRE